jgi:hypothetical protein
MIGIKFRTHNTSWWPEFSEPQVLVGWSPPAALAAVYAILVNDPTQRERPFRPIYFGSQADISVVGWLSSHPLYWRWFVEAERAGSALYIATHAPPMAVFSTYREAVESSLISWHRPACNMAPPFNLLSSILSKPAVAAAAGASLLFATAALRQSMTPTREGKMPRYHRIFISFAADDIRYRDLLVGQARNDRSPFDFIDMSVKQPWDSTWKTNCRTKIKGCDAMIALLSRNTTNADGARWEIKTAKEEAVPVLGVRIHSDDRTTVPELGMSRVIDWTWDGVSSFLKTL